MLLGRAVTVIPVISYMMKKTSRICRTASEKKSDFDFVLTLPLPASYFTCYYFLCVGQKFRYVSLVSGTLYIIWLPVPWRAYFYYKFHGKVVEDFPFCQRKTIER